MKTVFLDRETFPDWIRLPDACDSWTVFDHTSADQVIARSDSADILVVNKVVLDADTLKQLPRLKMIAVTATGTNNVDLAFCKSRGIKVNNVSGYAATTVAEYMIATLFALRRSLPSFQEFQNSKGWTGSRQFCEFVAPITELEGSCCGIIGQGAIGMKLAEKCRALGMTVRFADSRDPENLNSRTDFITMNSLLESSDQILLCCPLTASTQNLIDRPEFKRMKPCAILVNASRGGIVNEQALVEAITGQQIAGAALDVSVTEPLSMASPLLTLADHPGFILTPHIAWGSDKAMTTLLNQVVQNIYDFETGTTDHFLVS